MRDIDTSGPASAIAWRDVVDAMPALVFVLTADGSVTFVNRSFYTYTGLPESTPAAQAWSHGTHPEERDACATTLMEGVAGGEPFRMLRRIRGADGSYRSYESITVPYRDARGGIVQWFGVESNVETFLQTVAQREDAEERLRIFLDTVPIIVWTADASGWIDWYNPRWYAFTGQTADEAAGWGWQAAHHPEDFPKVMERWPESIRTGRPFEMEFRLRRADGGFRWMLTRVVPLLGPNGDVVRWFGSNTDIEEQKRAQLRSGRVAALLQEALLPTSLPTVAGIRLDALYQPAESDALVGGDFYDAIHLEDGRLLIACGDVTGHGLDAAASAARLRQTISFAGREDPDPASVLTRVNASVVAESGALATAVVAVFDPTTRELAYALAGHPPPLIGDADHPTHSLAPDGIPLGVDREAAYVTRTLRLCADSVLVLYTDGLLEFNRDVLAAEATLLAAVSRVVADPSTAEPARFVRDLVLGGAEVRDDIAILVLQLAPVGAASPSRTLPLRRTWRFHSSHALSARNARLEVATYFRALAARSDQVPEAELVVGELLANTVEHAPGLVELTVDWSDASPRLCIRDSGPGDGPPGQPALPDLLDENGRGLFLVHALADDVVVTASPTVGTEVSCRLRLVRGSADEAHVAV